MSTENKTDPVHALVVVASVGADAVRANLLRAALEASSHVVKILLYDAHREAAAMARRLAEIESAVRHDAEGN